MYVCWTWLFILSWILWFSLLLNDAFFTDEQSANNLLDNNEEFELLKNEESMKKMCTNFISDSNKSIARTISWTIRFWNAFVFILSFLCCILIYQVTIFFVNRIWPNCSKNYFKNIGYSSTSTSINPFWTFNFPFVDINAENNYKSIQNIDVNDASVMTDVTSNIHIKEVDKYNMQLKEAKETCKMLQNQIHVFEKNAFNERLALTCKLDKVSSQKRDLNKQLTVAQKETIEARYQIAEVVSERNMLKKKLEVRSSSKPNCTWKQQVDSLQSENRNLKCEIQQLHLVKDAYEKRVEAVESEIFKLKMNNNINHVISNEPICLQEKPEKLDRKNKSAISLPTPNKEINVLHKSSFKHSKLPIRKKIRKKKLVNTDNGSSGDHTDVIIAENVSSTSNESQNESQLNNNIQSFDVQKSNIVSGKTLKSDSGYFPQNIDEYHSFSSSSLASDESLNQCIVSKESNITEVNYFNKNNAKINCQTLTNENEISNPVKDNSKCTPKTYSTTEQVNMLRLYFENHQDLSSTPMPELVENILEEYDHSESETSSYLNVQNTFSTSQLTDDQLSFNKNNSSTSTLQECIVTKSSAFQDFMKSFDSISLANTRNN